MTHEQDRVATAPGDALGSLRLHRSEDGRTIAERDGQQWTVQVSSCFPWSAPGTFLSLRDEEGHEVALVPSVEEVEPDSREALRQALRDTAFSFEIERVVLVKKEFEIRHWVVVCAEGRRVFQTHVDDWPRPLPGKGLLITDVGGDVYKITDWTALDKGSRKQIAMFVA